MDWLNYHHLLYFRTVAKEGTVAAAADRLNLSSPTITSQIRKLEVAFGKKLFQPRGRRLALTAFGQRVLAHADEIFTRGEALVRMARDEGDGNRERLVVGLPDVMPKLVAFRILQPVLKLAPPVHLVCREGGMDTLLADLALHRLDIVLSDSPIPPGMNTRACNHKLGECGVSFFATPSLARKYRSGFPNSLHRAPVILPPERTALRREMDQWFRRNNFEPEIVAEIDDSALLKIFGEAGAGLFPAPSVVEKDVKARYQVQLVGRLNEVREEFFAISLDRTLKKPAVIEVIRKAKEHFFREDLAI